MPTNQEIRDHQAAIDQDIAEAQQILASLDVNNPDPQVQQRIKNVREQIRTLRAHHNNLDTQLQTRIAMNFLRKLGLFKTFFFIVLPLVAALFIGVSAYNDTLTEDLKGYLIAFGSVYFVIGVLFYLNRNTK